MGGASEYFSGSKRPDREHMNLDPCPYMRSASFMFLLGFISTGFLSRRATDLGKPDPTGLHRRHRREGHGATARTSRGLAYTRWHAKCRLGSANPALVRIGDTRGPLPSYPQS